MSDDEVRTFEPPKDAITKVTVRLCHDCLFRGFDVRKLITFCFEAKTDNHGCFTGDCAHTNQAQCTETILQQFMAD